MKHSQLHAGWSYSGFACISYHWSLCSTRILLMHSIYIEVLTRYDLWDCDTFSNHPAWNSSPDNVGELTPMKASQRIINHVDEAG